MRAATVIALAVLLALSLPPPDRVREAHAQGKGGGKGKGGGAIRCTIDSATSVNFGTYDPDAGRESNTSGRLQFTCQPNQTLTVQVNIGASAVSGSINDRRMRELGAGDDLQYNLFQDRRATVVWGDGASGGEPALVTGSGTFRIEIFGVMPPRQDVSAGTYADVVRITILP